MAGHVDRTVLSSYYQSPGEDYLDTKTEGAFETIAQAVDGNYDYTKTVEDYAKGLVNAGTLSRLGVINVKDYGAKGDGVADDTAAIQAAINAVISGSIDLSSGYQSMSTTPILYLPKGVYLISSSLNINTKHVNIAGSDAVLKANGSSITAFLMSNTYTARVEGVSFLNFPQSISFYNNNDDAGYLRINNCEFQETKSKAIHFNAQSSDLIIENSKFVNFNTGTTNAMCVHVENGTTITIDKCWIEVNFNYVFDVYPERISINNTTCVPTGGNVTWVALRRGAFFGLNTRFGAEESFVNCIVESWSDTTLFDQNTLTLIHCLIGTGNPIGNLFAPIAKLRKIPRNLTLSGNHYLYNTIRGIWIDPTLTISDLRPLMSIRNTLETQNIHILGNELAKKVFVADQQISEVGSTTISPSECLISMPSTHNKYTLVVNSNGVTINETGLDKFGNPKIRVTSNATGSTPANEYEDKYQTTGTSTPSSYYYYERKYVNLMAYLPATTDICTAAFNITISSGRVGITLLIGRQQINKVLTEGEYVINQPFYFDSEYPTIGIAFTNMAPGTIADLGSIRILNGLKKIDTVNGIYVSSAIPSNAIYGEGVWLKGDIVENSNLTELGSAGSKYVISKWVCTTSGTTATAIWTGIRSLTGN